MKPYHCDQCDKSFNHSGNLIRHKRTHTGVKPYHCEQCDRSFGNCSNFIRHKKIHTRTKPYHCYQSDKSYRKFTGWTIDLETQTEEKPTFSCSLVRHKKTSHMKETFSCDHCDKWFELLSDLNRHVQENLFEERICSVTLDNNLS